MLYCQVLLSGVLKEFILWGAETRSVAKWGVVLRSVVLRNVVMWGVVLSSGRLYYGTLCHRVL